MEVDLSDWLIAETARGEKRKNVEKLFTSYDNVRVKLEQGRFSKVSGPETEINQLELELKRAFLLNDDATERRGSDSEAVSGRASDVSQIQAENIQGQQHKAVRTPPEDNQTPERLRASALENAYAKDHMSTAEACASFADEMDVEKYVWNYMLFKHATMMRDLALNSGCGLTSLVLRRSSVDTNGKTQYRLQVRASTKTGLESAYEEIADLVVKSAEANIARRRIELHSKECFQELEEELKKKDVLLMSSASYVVGPASALDDAVSVVRSAVGKMYPSKWRLVSVSTDTAEKADLFQFHIPLVGLTVHVRQGMQRLQ